MPNLRSAAGFRMLIKNPSSWPAIARFAMGGDPSGYESLYRKELEAHGFKFSDKMTIAPDGAIFLLPPFPYSHVLEEIYVQKQYGDPQLAGRPVIDVGASIGDTALYFAKRGGRVFAYEVDRERYDLAVKNMELNKADSITLFNEPATAEKVNRLMSEKQLYNVFLKIDCEGCEYDIMPALDYGRISEIVMEYHKEPGPLIAALEKAGFTIETKGNILSAHQSSTV